MARGSLGHLPPVLKAANKIAVFDPAINTTLVFTPTFEANGVNFANYSDNYVRIGMKVKGESVTILLSPNASEAYNFARGAIGEISLVVVDQPFKAGGGVIDASETATISNPAEGYVDINLIREQ